MGPKSLFHYLPEHHALEVLCEVPQMSQPQEAEESCFYLALTVFLWRAVWRYGEPGYPVQQDCAHAIASICYAAKACGGRCSLVEDITDRELASLLGLRE